MDCGDDKDNAGYCAGLGCGPPRFKSARGGMGGNDRTDPDSSFWVVTPGAALLENFGYPGETGHVETCGSRITGRILGQAMEPGIHGSCDAAGVPARRPPVRRRSSDMDSVFRFRTDSRSPDLTARRRRLG